MGVIIPPTQKKKDFYIDLYKNALKTNWENIINKNDVQPKK
jgi:hypothetical protein